MKMWKNTRIDPVNERDLIFHDLIDECNHAPPGARLSYTLRGALEKYSRDVRRDIVNRVKIGCSPLFIACKKGQTEIVEYLVTVCFADIEQKGLFEVQEDRSTHIVSPLWCAAVTGKLPVVELLLKFGADINSSSDTGSTPVRSACFMTHFEIVKCLVDHGADVNRPNYNGGTCLINSVQSAHLCEFLLKNNADVNARDIQNKTALHYAIQEHRLETTKLLLKWGANYNAKSRYGDDALQMACLKGATRIFDFLTTRISYSPEKLANSHELMGATYLDEHNDLAVALFHWKKALLIRQKENLLPKQPVLKPHPGYRYHREFETLEELENISTDLDNVRIQSLMIAERILGAHHKDTIFRLMYRGASYADVMRYQRCINLWTRALEIRIEKDSILYTDTCFSAQALVRLMMEYQVRFETKDERVIRQRFCNAVSTFRLVTHNIVEIRKLLTIRPVYKRQADFFDKMLKCITHVIFLMIENACNDEEKKMVKVLVSDLLKKNLRCLTAEDTILHLCVSKLNTLRSSYFLDEDPIIIFPRANVIKCVLECGADINAKNSLGYSPLLLSTVPYNFSEWLVKLLLQFGAHIDQPNLSGKRPIDTIVNINSHHQSDIPVLNYLTLKCLCSTVIVKYKIPYKNQIPKTLEKLVKLHKP